MQRSPLALLRRKKKSGFGSYGLACMCICSFISSQLAQTERPISEPSALLLEEPPEDFPAQLLQTASVRDVIRRAQFCCFMSASLAVLTSTLYKSLSTVLALSYMQTNKNQRTSIQTLSLFTTLLLNLKIHPGVWYSQRFTHNWDGSSKIYSRAGLYNLTFPSMNQNQSID